MYSHSSRWTIYNGLWSLCYYIPELRKEEFFYKRILAFKEGELPKIKKWGNWSVAELSKINIRFDYIARSLGHEERNASGNAPLDILGKIISDGIGGSYMPNLLYKNRDTKKLSLLKTVKERKAEIKGAYSTNTGVIKVNKATRLLIIDDILTSGTTTDEIYNTIQSAYPGIKISLFALGKTNHESDCNDLIDRNYLS